MNQGPTRRQRLMLAVRRRRAAHLAAALALLWIVLGAFQTTRLDQQTRATRDEMTQAHTLKAGLLEALGPDAVNERFGSAAPTALRVLAALPPEPQGNAADTALRRAAQAVVDAEQRCEERRERCEAFSTTVGIPARWLGARCASTCGLDP